MEAEMDERLAGLLAEGEALRRERLVAAQAAELERMEAEKARWGAVLDQALPLVHPALVPFLVDPRKKMDEAPSLQNGTVVWLFFNVPEAGTIACSLNVGWVSEEERSFTVDGYRDNLSGGWSDSVNAEEVGLLLLEMHEGWVKEQREYDEYQKEREERVSREAAEELERRQWPMPVEFTDEQKEVIRELVVEASPEERIAKALGEIVAEVVADKVDRALRAAGLLDDDLMGDEEVW